VACSRVTLTFSFTFTTYTTIFVDTAPQVPRCGGGGVSPKRKEDKFIVDALGLSYVLLKEVGIVDSCYEMWE
jgi:hypothetical protein